MPSPGGRCLWGFVRRSDLIPLVALAFLAGTPTARAEPPARVVSVNLCTDQLAMLLAAPGQLISVSHLASDPLSSSMVAEAAAYPENRGEAEQVFLMRPDLVLAGEYTSLASVSLLRDLGVEVVQVPIVDSLAGVAEQVRLVGEALGQEAKAEAMARAFEADLAALAAPGQPASAVMYYPSGYTTGAGTLADDILQAGGFANVAAKAGLTGGGVLPLERLVMAAPDLIVTSTPYPAASRAEEILVHPALQAARERAATAAFSDPDWVCGTPFVLRALQAMVAARRALPEAGE